MNIERLLDRARAIHWYLGSLIGLLFMIFILWHRGVPTETVWILLAMAPFAAFGFSFYMKHVGRHLK